MTRVAIIDNNVLANFFDIERVDLLNLCRNIFDYILIPERVKIESENYCNGELPEVRKRFLSNIDTMHGFFRLCTTYDPLILTFIKTEKNIHLGEAEAIAQALKRSVSIFITEDKACINYLTHNYNFIRIFDTLFVVAVLNLQQYVSDEDYDKVLIELKKKHGYNSKMLRTAYLNAYRFLDLALNKKNFSRKISFSKIGLLN